MCRGIFCGWGETIVRLVGGPKFNGKYLHDLVEGFLGDTKLTQSLTNVVIPCFDIKKLQPVIFSSYQVTPKSICLREYSCNCIIRYIH